MVFGWIKVVIVYFFCLLCCPFPDHLARECRLLLWSFLLLLFILIGVSGLLSLTPNVEYEIKRKVIELNMVLFLKLSYCLPFSLHLLVFSFIF